MQSGMMQRIFLVLTALSLIIGLLGVRLFMIQTWEKRHYSASGVDLLRRSVAQRVSGIVLDDGRGHFYDRHLEPLTGERMRVLAVFPEWYVRHKPDPETVRAIAETLNITTDDWERWIEKQSAPALWKKRGEKRPQPLSEEQVQRLNLIDVAGVRVVSFVERYPKRYVASHVLGFTGQHPERLRREYADRLASGQLGINSRIGASGLEKTFDSFLLGLEESVIFHFVDGHNRPLEGLGLRRSEAVNRHYPPQVVTTLDKSLQTTVEDIVDESGMNAGAVVVLDVDTADVLAMVSRPNFDPERIEPDRDDWRNLAVKATIPGSVFKVVTAAAILEQRPSAASKPFFCSGEFGPYRFSCWKPGGHGRVTLAEAFAQSCNIAFAHAALMLEPGALERTADKMGLRLQNGWRDDGRNRFAQLDGEEAGRVFMADGDRSDPGAIVQAAIGQRDVRLSPLAAANMIVTILNDGVAKRPRIVSEVRYADGALVKRFPPQRLVDRGQGLNKTTAATLKTWMRRTVTEGTGRALLHSRWTLAGKSGTAQAPNAPVTDIQASYGSGREREHHWFTGFGPFDQPRYAVAVYVHAIEGRGGHAATQLFGRIMDGLAEWEAKKEIKEKIQK